MEAALALPQLLEKLASRAPLTGIDVIGLRLLLDRADAGSDASLAEQLLADDPATVAAEQRQHHALLLGLLNDVLRDLQIIFVDSIEEMLDAVLEGGLHGDNQGSMEILPEEGGHAGEDGPMPGVTATGSDADEPLLSNL